MALPAHLRLNAFKYPLAFVRLVELVFVVIALAAVNAWSYQLSFLCTDASAVQNKVDINTFSFDSVDVTTCETEPSKAHLWNDGEGYSGSAGFFYFVNSLALVSIFVGIFLYVVLWDLYQSNGQVRLADLGLTALCFILFFFCTSIWWSASNGIGTATSQGHVTGLLTNSPKFWNGTTPLAAALSFSAHNSLLAISVLAGWACVVLFALNCWYIWKEVAPTPASNPTAIA